MATDFIRHRDQATHNDQKPLIAQIDLLLLLPLLLLSVYGLYILYSASGQNFNLVIKQAVRLCFGLIVMLAIMRTPQRFWFKTAPIAYGLALGLLLAVLYVGIDAKGAQRWLVIPGVIRLQPSELMKLVIPLLLATYFAKNGIPPSMKQLLIGALIIAIPTALIAKQPDLGTSILIAYSGIVTLILAGIPWKIIGGLCLMSIPGAFVLWHFFMHQYQKTRVLTLLDPTQDPLGAGWNIIQSQAAIGSGGIEGKGWLQGTQSQLDFLPESSTDFIIAVVAEELGFKGALLLLGIYVAICARGLVIAWYAKDTFGRLIAATFTFTFFIYFFVNIGMVSGILPVVGVPLPLVSYGGSSIVSLMASFGFIMATHAQRVR